LGGFCTKRKRTPRPSRATQKLTTKTESKASGAYQRRAKARIGPRSAPIVSSARWTPNERPRFSGWLESEMRASRGALRMPLPIRSRKRKPAVGATVEEASSPTLVAAEMT
jgi:hypothetical protein